MFSHGLILVNMRDSDIKTKFMEMAKLFGLTKVFMKESFMMDCKMDTAHILEAIIKNNILDTE